MNQALEILPSDYWRWWLLSHVPENSDSEFTWENFQSSINKDLADVLGNFVSRVTKFCRSKFGESIPKGKLDHAVQQNLVNDLQKQVDNYQAHMEALEIRKAAYELRKIWVAGNEFLQKTEFEPKTLNRLNQMSSYCKKKLWLKGACTCKCEF